ncbi:hypothetical protein EV143_101635 [Flavobacterium chryseum]|uniref:Lipoprotein n=1 Tax=Flavobacterium circumlabens TaxID=2133765 RepID=A0A4Y7U902_9FLAO|nr:hypothetical protein [Flavobacterium]TCN53835.1 hypothetical protein EV142_108140 [Flavobacterium circumlabens]TDO84189.1 hypothetical protein EV143_101635 [Flavobacterium sp. P3160]TEB42568.1 hypothetical protein D0809_19610 [Flavobacterium circumlabens]
MIERIIKRKKNNVLGVIILLLLSSCNSEILVYSINKDFTGVCAVFIFDDLTNTELVKINNDGLSHISETDMNKNFIFIQNKVEIECVPIGSKTDLRDSHRYIFQLTNNTISSKCVDSDIKVITFFIGTNKDFLEWSNMNKGELEYLSDLGIDWCSYYKELLDVRRVK